MTEFVQRWADAWADPTSAKVGALAAPDLELHWPGGSTPVRGADAWAAQVDGLLHRFPDLRLDVTDHAQRDDIVFISWQAHATVGGTPATWSGIDRMRLQAGHVREALVTFDTAPLRPAP